MQKPDADRCRRIATTALTEYMKWKAATPSWDCPEDEIASRMAFWKDVGDVFYGLWEASKHSA